jgi:hypothetical protein
MVSTVSRWPGGPDACEQVRYVGRDYAIQNTRKATRKVWRVFGNGRLIVRADDQWPFDE